MVLERHLFLREIDEMQGNKNKCHHYVLCVETDGVIDYSVTHERRTYRLLITSPQFDIRKNVTVVGETLGSTIDGASAQ